MGVFRLLNNSLHGMFYELKKIADEMQLNEETKNSMVLDVVAGELSCCLSEYTDKEVKHAFKALFEKRGL